MYICVYIFIYVYKCIYIYIYRERDLCMHHPFVCSFGLPLSLVLSLILRYTSPPQFLSPPSPPIPLCTRRFQTQTEIPYIRVSRDALVGCGRGLRVQHNCAEAALSLFARKCNCLLPARRPDYNFVAKQSGSGRQRTPASTSVPEVVRRRCWLQVDPLRHCH